MIIAVTRDNENLINQVCKEIGQDVQVMTGVTNIRRFAIQEMKNLNDYSNIIIDLLGISDTEEDIVDAVVALKSMYNIRAIIIAMEYQCGNSLLARLFNEGIYNFVTTMDIQEQERELLQCIEGVGKQYKDSVRYRDSGINAPGTDKIIIKKERKKSKKCVTIGIAGAQEHIGITSQALATTKFLNDLQMNDCYIQANKKEGSLIITIIKVLLKLIIFGLSIIGIIVLANEEIRELLFNKGSSFFMEGVMIYQRRY